MRVTEMRIELVEDGEALTLKATDNGVRVSRNTGGSVHFSAYELTNNHGRMGLHAASMLLEEAVEAGLIDTCSNAQAQWLGKQLVEVACDPEI